MKQFNATSLKALLNLFLLTGIKTVETTSKNVLAEVTEACSEQLGAFYMLKYDDCMNYEVLIFTVLPRGNH